MSKAERYAEHVLSLAQTLGVEVVVQGGGRANRRRRRVKIPAIRGQVSYLVALHELGHIAVKPEPVLRLDQEVAAWEWALANTLDEPTLATWRSILRCLESYEERAERWSSMKRSLRWIDYLARVRQIVDALA